MGACVSKLPDEQPLPGLETTSARARAQECHFAKLPVDVLYTIKALLPPRSYRALLQSSSSLHAALHLTTHTCKLLTPTPLLPTPPPPPPPSPSNALSRLSRPRAPPAPPPPASLPAFAAAIHHCPHIHTLDLTPVSKQLTPALLCALLGSLSPPQLQCITTLLLGNDTPALPPSAPIIALRMLPRLATLDCQLSSTSACSADAFEAILDACGHLRHATFCPGYAELYPYLNAIMLKILAEHCPPQLQLDMHQWRATTLQLHSCPAAFANIVSLQIRCTCDYLPGTQGMLPNLESVQLHCCDIVTLQPLSRSFLATATKLRTLHACWLDVSGPTAWLADLPCLETLVLSHAKLPAGDAHQWPALQAALPHLTSLILDMCTGVPEAALYPPLPPTPAATDPPTFSPTPATTPLGTALRTLAISTHWGTGTRPSCTTIHRWLKALTALPSDPPTPPPPPPVRHAHHHLLPPHHPAPPAAPRPLLPSCYALSSVYLHFNDTDVEADQALPHLGALCRLPNLTTLQLSTTRVRSVESKMVLPAHLDGIRALAACPALRTLRLLFGWLTPEALAALPPALPRLTHLAWVASPESSSVRKYAHVVRFPPPAPPPAPLTFSVTFVAAARDLQHHHEAYRLLLEAPAVTHVHAVLLEARAAEKVVGHVLANVSVEQVDFVLPRVVEDAYVRERVVVPLKAAGVGVGVGYHAGCFQAWARALGDPGVVRNAERNVEHRDWRVLQL